MIAHQPYGFSRYQPPWNPINFGGSNVQINYRDELPTLNDELADEEPNDQSEGQTGNNQDEVVESVQQLVNNELFNEIIRREQQKEKNSHHDVDAALSDESDGRRMAHAGPKPVNIPTQDVGLEEGEDEEEKPSQDETMTSANSQNLAYSYSTFVPSYQAPPSQAYANFVGKSGQRRVFSGILR